MTTTYKYNALGQRVSKTTGATTTYYVYDDDQIIGEYSNATTALSEHVYLNGVPVGLMQNNNLYYIYVDHLNTPRAIADTSNNNVWTWDNNDAFGNNQPSSNLSGFVYNLRFSGQYFDSENNLAYNYYRNYNSLTGRYMQSDPIGLDGGINTYGYVGGNSLNFNDPLGLLPSLNEHLVDFFTELGDAYSLSITKIIRKSWGIYQPIPKSVNNTNISGVISWICYAENKSDFDPKGILTKMRELGLDKNSPNLSAAERYYEGYNGYYNRQLILLQHFSKGIRDVQPLKTFLPNGSSPEDSPFITTWGFLGADQRENNLPVLGGLCGCKK